MNYCRQSYMEVTLVVENDIMLVIEPMGLKIILCTLILQCLTFIMKNFSFKKSCTLVFYFAVPDRNPRKVFVSRAPGTLLGLGFALCAQLNTVYPVQYRGRIYFQSSRNRPSSGSVRWREMVHSRL